MRVNYRIVKDAVTSISVTPPKEGTMRSRNLPKTAWRGRGAGCVVVIGREC